MVVRMLIKRMNMRIYEERRVNTRQCIFIAGRGTLEAVRVMRLAVEHSQVKYVMGVFLRISEH